MESKIFPSNKCAFLTRCLPIELAQKQCWLAKIFLPRLPRMEEIQRMLRMQLGLFEKIDEFFSGKNLIFFKFAKGGKIAVECESTGIIS